MNHAKTLDDVEIVRRLCDGAISRLLVDNLRGGRAQVHQQQRSTSRFSRRSVVAPQTNPILLSSLIGALAANMTSQNNRMMVDKQTQTCSIRGRR